MGNFEGRIGLIPCSVFFYCLGFQIGVHNYISLTQNRLTLHIYVIKGFAMKCNIEFFLKLEFLKCSNGHVERRTLVPLIHQSELEGYFHHPKGSTNNVLFTCASCTKIKCC